MNVYSATVNANQKKAPLAMQFSSDNCDLPSTWRIMPVSKLVTPIYMPFIRHLEREQPDP